MRTIRDLTQALSKHDQVLGLIEFGSRHLVDDPDTGDYDLLVILAQLDYPVTSLHFYVDKTAVDLNFRTIDQLRRLETTSGFERALFCGRVIYDPTGEISQHVQRLNAKSFQVNDRQLTEDDLARIRHWHKHILDKVQGRTSRMPTLCYFLLSTNIFWLIENYCRIRHITYRGPKAAFDHIEQSEPEIYARIRDFYSTNDLEQKIKLTRELAELVLQPVNGMWQDDEVLAFGDKTSQELQEQGQRLFKVLFTDLYGE